MQIRPLKQNWDQELPKYWFDNSPVKTAFFDSLSLTFPEGEQFFIDSVKLYSDRISDPVLLEDIRVFTAQEHWHTYAHKNYNNWIASSHEISLQDLTKSSTDKINFIKEKFGRRAQLASTVSIEHITAILSHWILTNPQILEQMHPHFRELWKWHCTEEYEHKAVTYDVWLALTSNRVILRRALFVATLTTIHIVVGNMITLLKKDGELYKWGTLKDAAEFLFNRKNGLIRHTLEPWFSFLRKDFHPSRG